MALDALKKKTMDTKFKRKENFDRSAFDRVTITEISDDDEDENDRDNHHTNTPVKTVAVKQAPKPPNRLLLLSPFSRKKKKTTSKKTNSKTTKRPRPPGTPPSRIQKQTQKGRGIFSPGEKIVSFLTPKKVNRRGLENIAFAQ